MKLALLGRQALMGVMAVALVAGMSVKTYADEGLLNKVKERGTLLVGLAPAWGGLFGMMLVQGALEVYLLHESQKLNDAIPSDQRATLISVDGMAYSLLMIPASPLVGAVGDAFGQAGAGLALLGGVIVLSGVAPLGKKPQRS